MKITDAIAADIHVLFNARKSEDVHPAGEVYIVETSHGYPVHVWMAAPVELLAYAVARKADPICGSGAFPRWGNLSTRKHVAALAFVDPGFFFERVAQARTVAEQRPERVMAILEGRNGRVGAARYRERICRLLHYDAHLHPDDAERVMTAYLAGRPVRIPTNYPQTPDDVTHMVTYLQKVVPKMEKAFAVIAGEKEEEEAEARRLEEDEAHRVAMETDAQYLIF